MTKTTALNTDTTIDIVNYPAPSPRCSLDFCIHLADNTLLGDTILRLESFSGNSKVSQPFEYQLDLRADDTKSDSKNIDNNTIDNMTIDNTAIDNTTQGNETADDKTASPENLTYILSLKNILGRPATISMQLPANDDTDSIKTDDDAPETDTTPFIIPNSYVNGIISSFSMVEAGHYQASLKPALWRLTLSNNYQLYSNMTIKGIISAIVKDKHQIECDLEGLQGIAIARTQDWLQAGESDFDFITRLMNKVSIYYYFVHSFGSHKVVFANKPCYQKLNQRLADGSLSDSPLTLYYTFSKVQSLQENDLIEDFSYRQDLTTSRVNSLIAEPHAAWEKNETATHSRYDSTTLETTEQVVSDSETFNQYQIYQYGSKKDEAIDFAQLEMNKLQTSASEISGKTACRELKPGYQFTTEQHKATDENATWRPSVLEMRPEFSSQNFVVTSVNEQAQASGEYQCQFAATSSDGQIAPFDLHNTHMGSVLAVVSPAPDDKASSSKYLHYLEKNNFSHYSNHFNSTFSGKYKAQGVYVKFTTNSPDADATWVKLAEHMQTVPEVGVTVLVSRSNDESEIPEIQSIIQSKGNHVITPNGATDNTNWGDNYSTSYGDSHSIRYGKKSTVDLESARKIITDQYATGKFKDVSYSKGGSYSYSIANDGMPGMLSTSYSEGSTYSTFKGQTTESHSTIGTSTNDSTIGTSTSTSTIGTSNNDSTVDFSSNTSLTGISDSTSATGDSSNLSALGISTGFSVTGASRNVSATGLSANLSATGLSTNLSVTGLSLNISGTGISSNISSTSISDNLSSTGVSTSLNTTGASSSINVTGISDSASGTGVSVSTNYVGSSNSLSVTPLEQSVNVVLSGYRASESFGKPSFESSALYASMEVVSTEIISSIKATL